MGGKIGRRYTSLARAMEISDYRPAYALTDDVLPVVLLHEHCEGEHLTANGGLVGIQAAANLFPPIAIPHTGAYQITAYVYMRLAVALVGTTEVVVLRVRQSIPVGAPDESGVSILRWDHGEAAPLVSYVTIPKVHLEEGSELALYLATAILANDQVYGLLTVQPI